MKTKTFDCVEMKHKIQEQLIKENQGVSRDEELKRFRDRINRDDSKFGKFIRKLMKKES